MQYAALAGMGGIGAAIAPFIVQDPVLMLSPCSQKVHTWAEKVRSSEAAHVIQLLHYLAKPIDRLIQAVVAPLLKIIAYFEELHDCFKEKQTLLGCIVLLVAPIAIPVMVIWGLFESILLLGNGAIQLFIPFSATYNVIYGKEAAREYFNFRQNQQDRQITDKGHACIARMIAVCYKLPPYKDPKRTIQQMQKKTRICSRSAATLFDIGDRCRTKTEQDVASLFFITQPTVVSVKMREFIHS